LRVELARTRKERDSYKAFWEAEKAAAKEVEGLIFTQGDKRARDYIAGKITFDGKPVKG